MQLPNISRREFLKRSVASGCAFAVGGLIPPQVLGANELSFANIPSA